MTGTTRTSADLDPRRRRILMRAWRRGIREMDLVFGGFSDLYLADLSNDELDQFEALMIENDIDLLSWVTGAVPVPEVHNTALFRKIIAFEGVPSLFFAPKNADATTRPEIESKPTIESKPKIESKTE